MDQQFDRSTEGESAQAGASSFIVRVWWAVLFASVVTAADVGLEALGIFHLNWGTFWAVAAAGYFSGKRDAA